MLFYFAPYIITPRDLKLVSLLEFNSFKFEPVGQIKQQHIQKRNGTSVTRGKQRGRKKVRRQSSENQLKVNRLSERDKKSLSSSIFGEENKTVS